jgi:hypothetical protein
VPSLGSRRRIEPREVKTAGGTSSSFEATPMARFLPIGVPEPQIAGLPVVFGRIVPTRLPLPWLSP